MSNRQSLAFADVMAATMHDTKNSLGMLYNNIEELLGRCREQQCDIQKEFHFFQYEIKRLNNGLIRLLSLYKAQKERLSVNMDLHCVSDCIDESVVQNAPLLNSKGITIEMDCPDDLFWAFDYHLVLGVIDNILNNAYRYTRDKVIISAINEGPFLVISIGDNGPGYPPAMLFNTNESPQQESPVSFKTGSTGLGFYFSSIAAKSHSNKGRCGYVSTTNGGVLGGGVFSIHLP